MLRNRIDGIILLFIIPFFTTGSLIQKYTIEGAIIEVTGGGSI